MIPLISPIFPTLDSLLNSFTEIYSSGIFTNNGSFSKQLEGEICDYIGCKHALLVSNGTVSLELIIKSLNIENKIIAVPNFTFCATVQAIINTNNKPYYIDIDKYNLTIDLEDLERNKENFDVVLAVDSFGNPCDKDSIKRICKDKIVIFDSAGSFGSTYKGLKNGNCDTHSFSLHATKVFPVGEGGLIITDDTNIYETIKKMRNFGLNDNGEVEILKSTNAKMDEMRCAIGLESLKNLETHLSNRQSYAEFYKNNLINFNFINLCNKGNTNTYQLFPIMLHSKEQRDNCQKWLYKNNIMSKIYYTPFDKNIDLKNTNFIFDRILCIPLWSVMELDTLKHITDVLNKFED